VRSSHWKYLHAGNADEYIFDLSSDVNAMHNVTEMQLELAAQLKQRLADWTKELKPPGMPDHRLDEQEASWD